MTKNTSMTTRFRWSRFVLPVVVGTAMLAADGAAAGEREHEKLPGYVDVSGFAELADEDSELVEVSIHGPLLKVLARAAGDQQAGLNAVFAGIQSISAVIVEDTGQMDRAKKKMREIADQLKEKGWERIALVREASQMVLVYVHVDDEEGEESIDGLVVMVKEGKGKVLTETERQRLREVDDALRRIEIKTYGICQLTGKPIPKARLKAKPWAKYTIESARQMEGQWRR